MYVSNINLKYITMNLDILLVEDEEKISSLVKKGLEEENYDVTVADSAEAAIEILNSKTFSIYIFDIMLPGISGLDLCKKLRQNQDKTPILMLTALGEVDDRVDGLDAGADDYLVKPFHFKELLARVRSLTKRLQPEGEDKIIKKGDLVLNKDTHEVFRAGTKLELTVKEFDLLEYFMLNENRVLKRKEISEKVWNINFDTGTNVIDVYVNYLRNKLDKPYEHKYIQTVIGVGYVFKQA
jgi:two-component system, OmpR family, copper resistance phosphate regulon response regulator CusR